MAFSRSKRTSKKVDYLATENVISDDDDFCEYTPPLKKIKETRKKKESIQKCESDSVSSVTHMSKDRSKERSPKKRLTLEEKKFQRELEMAIELSAADSGDFQGFHKEKEEKLENLEFFSPLRDTVVTAEVHSLPEGEEILQVNAEIPEAKDQKDELVFPSEKKEAVPSIPTDCTQKRLKKKVNFVEDNSDSWSEDEIKAATPESDESDYFPSPTKLKKKRESKKLKNPKKKEPPSTKTKPVPLKRTLRNKQASSATTAESSIDNGHAGDGIETEGDGMETVMLPLPLRSQVNDKLITVDNEVTVEMTRDDRKETDESESEAEETVSVKCGKMSKSKIEPKLSSSSNALKLKTNSTNVKDNLPSKSNNSFDIKPSKPPNLIFRSPVISASSCQPSPKTPPTIGLRLGLSRKISAKPLHPKASVK